jgi:hypothetical protein
VAKLDRKRAKKGSNEVWVNPLLTAANEGAILAGPEGATPLLLDGGDGTLSGSARRIEPQRSWCQRRETPQARKVNQPDTRPRFPSGKCRAVERVEKSNLGTFPPFPPRLENPANDAGFPTFPTGKRRRDLCSNFKTNPGNPNPESQQIR